MGERVRGRSAKLRVLLEGKVGRIGVGGTRQRDHAGQDLRMLRRDVAVLAHIGRQVVKGERFFQTILIDLPVALAQGDAGLSLRDELPIEVGMPSLGLTQQFRQEGKAVASGGSRGAGDGGEGRQEIPDGEGDAAEASRARCARASGQEGARGSHLHKRRFSRRARAAGIEEIDIHRVIGSRAEMGGPIVGRDENQRVLVEAELAQAGHDFSHMPVEAPDHGGENRRGGFHPVGGSAVGQIERLVEQAIIGRREFSVRQRQGQVQEERLGAMPLEKGQGLPHEEVVDVGLFRESIVAGQRDFLGVAVDEFGIVVMGVGVVEKPVKGVKALAPGNARRALFSQTPLPDAPGGIAGGLQHPGHRDIVGLEADPARFARGIVTEIGANPLVAGVEARHQGAARRGAFGGAIEVGELQALAGEPVNRRRLVAMLPVAAQLAIAVIVGENDHDVGSRRCGRRRIGERSQAEGAGQRRRGEAGDRDDFHGELRWAGARDRGPEDERERTPRGRRFPR